MEKYIEKENMIKTLQNVLSFRSVKSKADGNMPYGRNIGECLEYVLSIAEEMGFKTKNIDNQVGYAEYGSGEEMIAVLGHLDVVPEGDGWSCPPYEGTIADGKIYGRGTMDDKGPMVAALYALNAIKKSGITLKRRIRIIFGTDEESGSNDIVRYKQSEEFPVMAFTPDADYPVIFSEKGLINFVLSKEIGDEVLSEAHGGSAVNQVPDWAFAKFKNSIRFEAKGKAAHGGNPEKGLNAIDALIGKLSVDEQISSPKLKEFVDFYMLYLQDNLSGQKFGINHEDDELGGTTMNVGLLKYEKGVISVTVDYRYPYGYDAKTKLKNVKEIAQKKGIDFKKTKDKAPLYFSKEEKLIRILNIVYEDIMQTKTKPIAIGGGTYAKSLPNTVAFGPLFPGNENVIHQKDEYISIDELFLNARIIGAAMRQLANA